MFSLLFIIIPLLSQNLVHSSTVLLWSNSNLPQTAVPLSQVSSLDVVSNHICAINDDKIQIRLFAVNQLANEYLLRGSQKQHSLLIDAKKEHSQYRYFPNIDDDAYRTFSLIDRSNNMACAHIQIKIDSSNIYETLHDALNAMQTSVESVGTNSDETVVMVLVTGPVRTEKPSRQRRQIEIYEDDLITSDDDACLFFADNLILNSTNDKSNITLNYEQSSCNYSSTTNSTVLDLIWNDEKGTKYQTVLSAVNDGRYWYLNDVKFNNETYRYFAYGMHSNMDTPSAYSYACTTAQFVKYSPTGGAKGGVYDFNSKFAIRNFQFQPFNGTGNKFGSANYCTSFFTSGIWMGITSSLLCLGILLVGVTRMMSIKSNDRFDDPKGKALVIKAQE